MKKIMVMFAVMFTALSVFADARETAFNFIAKNEGYRANVYKCTAGKLTIGYGFTAKKYVAMKFMSKAQANEILYTYVDACMRVVEDEVKVQLTDNQKAVLCDFIYHFGSGAFRESTLLKVINANQFNRVPSELMRWTKQKKRDANGNVVRNANGSIVYETVAGLANRAARRVQLWSK